MQAEDNGVPRHILSRLEKNENIIRYLQGIYRIGGSPTFREDDVFAQWLALCPNVKPGASVKDNQLPIVFGTTAAWLQELGELEPCPYEFCLNRRKQSQRKNLKLHRRNIDESDITIVAGLPCLCAQEIVIELLKVGEDLSLIANVLRDCYTKGLIKDEAKLKNKVNAYNIKRKYGFLGSLFDYLCKEGSYNV
ncbi:MAG: hypothetical protein HUJ63_11645 [Enterococcus sp.]|nr:hypothetical protein [Enterococcus sp.]